MIGVWSESDKLVFAYTSWVVQELGAGVGDVRVVPSGLTVDRELDVDERDRAIREGVRDDIVHVARGPGKRDLDLDGDTNEVCRVVPRLVDDLARVELGGLDGADVALFGWGAGVLGLVGGKIRWYHGPVAIPERVVDRDVDGNSSGRWNEEYEERKK